MLLMLFLFVVLSLLLIPFYLFLITIILFSSYFFHTIVPADAKQPILHCLYNSEVYNCILIVIIE